jgi:hypothetical protein
MIIRLDDNTWYKNGCSISYWYCFERLENNNAVIRSRKLRKDKQYNCQTKNDQRKHNNILSTQLIILHRDPHCKPLIVEMFPLIMFANICCSEKYWKGMIKTMISYLRIARKIMTDIKAVTTKLPTCCNQKP